MSKDQIRSKSFIPPQINERSPFGQNFMNYKIISDSSSDILELEGVNYQTVPLTISTDERQFVDDKDLDTTEMLDYLYKYNGKSGSACPGIGEWLDAFEETENIFCVTMTSSLSGTFNSARAAIKEYQHAHPKYRACVIDSLSTGPEAALIIYKLVELIEQGLSFDEIKAQIKAYKETTHLLFCLESLKNLANNGRVSPIVAKLAGVFGIRIVGKASNDGVLEIVEKSKGAKKAIADMWKNMQLNGYSGGAVRIHHCENEEAAQALQNLITEAYPEANVIISTTHGLCSFYAERGGLLVGFEGASKYAKHS